MKGWRNPNQVSTGFKVFFLVQTLDPGLKLVESVSCKRKIQKTGWSLISFLYFQRGLLKANDWEG